LVPSNRPQSIREAVTGRDVSVHQRGSMTRQRVDR